MAMERAKLFICVLSCVISLLASPAAADWINLSGAQSAPNIAEIYIEDSQVRLVLEIYVNDIEKFIDLLPDDWLLQAGIKPPPLEERMRRFSTDTFQVLADDTNRLVATQLRAEPRLRQDRPNPFAGSISPFTGQPIPGPPEDRRVLWAELVYPFQRQPRSLTFIPPTDAAGITRAAIGFVTYHKSVPVLDFRYLSEAARVQLDWQDPWYSQFENKALKRWQQSGIKTFLYIEPFEVRHETLVRVKDMQAWMDLGLRGDEYIEVDEFEPLKKRIGEFLLQRSKVRIDGQSLPPILDRTSFVKYTMTRTFFIDQPERLLLNTAMVGVIITYLTRELPQKVSVDWDLFSDKIQKVPTNAVDPVGPFPSYVTADDNQFTWTNFLKNYQAPTVAGISVDEKLIRWKLPIASLFCLLLLVPIGLQIKKHRGSSKKVAVLSAAAAAVIAAGVLLYPLLNVSVARPAVMAPEMKESEAVAVLDSLLKNIYRSFDFREEQDVYDRLATSVTGNLLTDIYLQNRKSLVVTQAGGARARVAEVDIQQVKVDPLEDRPLGMRFRAKWTALGSVGHWGHIHTRENFYEADIEVAPVDGVWKITGLQLLEEKRIDPAAQPKT